MVKKFIFKSELLNFTTEIGRRKRPLMTPYKPK